MTTNVADAAPEAGSETPLAKRIAQLFQMRAKIAEIKEAQKKALAPYTDAEDKLEALITEALQTMGTTSTAVRGIGTVYLGSESTASVADMDALKRHVIGSQEFDLVDFRANKVAVREWIGAHEGNTPPGVNFSTRVRLGVRKDSSGAA